MIITASQIMSDMLLIQEAAEGFPDWACKEIARYNLDAGKRLDPKVEKEVAKYLPSSPITLYRGLGFDIASAVRILKKFKIDSKVGSKGVYKTAKIQSWAANAKQAKEFAGLFMFGNTRDPDSLGLIIKAKIKPEQISVPIARLPPEVKKKCIKFDQDEYLLKGGSFQIEVVDLLGDWPAKDDVNIEKEIKIIGKELANKTKGKLGRTWNKAPGVSIAYDQWAKEPKTYSPSIEIQLFAPDRVVFYKFSSVKIKDLDRKDMSFKGYSDFKDYILSGKLSKDYLDYWNKVDKVHSKQKA